MVKLTSKVGVVAQNVGKPEVGLEFEGTVQESMLALIKFVAENPMPHAFMIVVARDKVDAMVRLHKRQAKANPTSVLADQMAAMFAQAESEDAE